MTLSQELKKSIRNIPDFPTKGIQFKDITTVLTDPELNGKVVQALTEKVSALGVDVVIGIESRGFLFGMALAIQLNMPFVPVRKRGKLPYKTVSTSYDLEYGSAVIEMHEDAFSKDARVFIHDDVLATGGTALATADLVMQLGGQVTGFGFLAEFSSLAGREKIAEICPDIYSLVKY